MQAEQSSGFAHVVANPADRAANEVLLELIRGLAGPGPAVCRSGWRSSRRFTINVMVDPLARLLINIFARTHPAVSGLGVSFPGLSASTGRATIRFLPPAALHQRELARRSPN